MPSSRSSLLGELEITDTIIIQGTHIDCGRRIMDSLTGRNIIIFNQGQNLPRDHKPNLGDKATVPPASYRVEFVQAAFVNDAPHSLAYHTI